METFHFRQRQDTEDFNLDDENSYSYGTSRSTSQAVQAQETFSFFFSLFSTQKKNVFHLLFSLFLGLVVPHRVQLLHHHRLPLTGPFNVINFFKLSTLNANYLTNLRSFRFQASSVRSVRWHAGDEEMVFEECDSPNPMYMSHDLND